jgi:hypothetical protein
MKCLLSILLLIAVVLLSACSSARGWCIRTRNGQDLACASEPRLQGKTGYYRYRTAQGTDALLRADEVLNVERR